MGGRRRGLSAAILVVLAVAACNPQLLAPNRTIGGRLILDQATPVERGGGECRGTGGYSDLRSGVVAVVRDESGTRLADAPLTAEPAPTTAAGTISEAERRRCVWTFTLRDIPERPAYRIAIGERGSVRYTREELEAAGWNIDVSLGG